MAKRKPSSRQKLRKAPTKEIESASKALDRDMSRFWLKDLGLKPGEKKKLRYVCIGLALVMALLSLRVGLNGDDDVQANYASDLPAFYTSFGSDTSCFSSGPEIKYYGAFFEIVTGASNNILGFDKSQSAYYQVRHVWNAIFGSIAIYFLALIIGEIAGFQAAVLGVVLLFFSMRFLGHSFINPKDIPFAAGYTVSLYYIYQILRTLPHPPRSTLWGMAIGIAMSVGVRIGGVLVIAYLGLFVALYFILKHGFKSIFHEKAKPYYRSFFMPSALGLAGALLVWPYGLVNPLQHIPATLDAFANFQYAIKVLFDDRQVWSSDIPVEYLLTWMTLTFPIYTLLGLLLFIFFLRGILIRYNFIPIVLCFFGFAFPIIYVLMSGSILYDGWRHFLFTYPPLMVVVTLAWYHLLTITKNSKVWRYLTIGILAIGVLESAVFLVRNSAFPYIYFNPIAGGIKGAYGSFELDYWGTSVKQAVEAMEREGILSDDMQDTVTIGTNFSHAVSVYTQKYKGMVKVNYVRWRQRNDKQWEYGLFVNRFVDGVYLKNGHWPTSKTIQAVKCNGWPIAIIEKDALNSDAYLAAQAVQRQDWERAIYYAELETKAHPDNEMAWIGLGMAYLNIGQMQRAKIPLDRAISIVPDNQNALNFLGYYYFATDNYNEAYTTFEKAVELHQTDVTAYYYLSRIAYVRKNFSQSLEYALTGIDYDTKNPLCYQVAAEAYRALGDRVNGQRYEDAFIRLSGR